MQPKETEEKLISSIKTPEDLSLVILSGVNYDNFLIRGDVFKFISMYSSKYGSIPSPSIISNEFPDFNFNNTNSEELKFFIDELQKQDVKRKTTKLILKTGEKLEKDEDIYFIVDSLITKLSSIRKIPQFTMGYTDKDAMKRYEEYLETKEKMSHGMIIGIRTGLSFFDDDLIGWQPGNLIAIIARMKVGKTWLGIYICCSAYLDNKRVLFISPEMTKKEIDYRWDTTLSRFHGFQISNMKLIKAQIEEKVYKKWLEKASERADWQTVCSDYGRPFTLSSIESFVDQFRPDLVCFDGFLNLRPSSYSAEPDWQTRINLANGLKSIAQNKNVVFLATAQVNRKATGMPKPEDLYGGDALAFSADTMLAIEDNEEEPNSRYLSIALRRGGEVMNKKKKIHFNVDVGDIGV